MKKEDNKINATEDYNIVYSIKELNNIEDSFQSLILIGIDMIGESFYHEIKKKGIYIPYHIEKFLETKFKK